MTIIRHYDIVETDFVFGGAMLISDEMGDRGSEVIDSGGPEFDSLLEYSWLEKKSERYSVVDVFDAPCQ